MRHALRILGSAVVGGAVVAVLAAFPAAAQEIGSRDVAITTDDKMTIAGTLWPSASGNAPGVVLLHMYKSDRTAWAPLVRHLNERGADVLAIDLRGHGGSAKQGKSDLAPRVEKRDAKLFQDMHKDAIAAVRYLVREVKSDPARVVIVGASVGCSVAIDTARRHPKEVAAVACLSPGSNYLGLNTLEHAKAWPKDRPLLLLAHASEAAAGAAQVRDAVPGSRLVTYDDPEPEDAKGDPMWAHGTRMFGRIPLVEQTVASFVAARTGSEKDDVVLDGVVADEGPDADPWAKATDVTTDASGLRAFRVGRRVVFGGKVPDGQGSLLLALETGSVKVKGEDGQEVRRGAFSVAAIDLASGKVAWTVPTKEQVKDSILEAPEPPAVRVVRTDGVTTVEGEWRSMRFLRSQGISDTSSVRCLARFASSLPEPPSESNPLDLEGRQELKSR